jgi:hypothetical protein
MRKPHHRSVLLGAGAMLALCADSAGVSAADMADISGVWWTATYRAKIEPVEGGPIPFTPKGQAAYEKNVNGLKDGSVADFALTLCVPPGVIRTMGAPYPFEIVQTPGQVTFLMEVNNVYRTVRLDDKHSDDIEIFPGFMGDQIGRWDGDTLVIDTLGVNPHTWLDASGVPHGYDLHTVERIRRVDGGRRLEDVITIEDAENFSRAWSVRFVYEPRSDVAIESHLCGENERDLSSVQGAPQ